MAGVSRMRAAMPRAGETHSSLHAQHAGSSRVRAPQRSRGEAASAPILGTPPSRYGHDLGGMDTSAILERHVHHAVCVRGGIHLFSRWRSGGIVGGILLKK